MHEYIIWMVMWNCHLYHSCDYIWRWCCYCSCYGYEAMSTISINTSRSILRKLLKLLSKPCYNSVEVVLWDGSSHAL